MEPEPARIEAGASQFADASGEYVLRQPATTAFVQGRELGPGLLTVDERYFWEGLSASGYNLTPTVVYRIFSN